VHFWDVATRKEKEVLRVGPAGWVGGFYSHDGRHLITHNPNGTVYVLRLTPPPAARP
jgi:hypothetical protein